MQFVMSVITYYYTSKLILSWILHGREEFCFCSQCSMCTYIPANHSFFPGTLKEQLKLWNSSSQTMFGHYICFLIRELLLYNQSKLIRICNTSLPWTVFTSTSLAWWQVASMSLFVTFQCWQVCTCWVQSSQINCMKGLIW